VVRSQILSAFLPSRIREGLLSKHVLDRFQNASEDLSHFIMSVVAAINILEYGVPESALLERMVQSIHPEVRSRLVFVTKPTLIASQVAEGRAIDERRIRGEYCSSNTNVRPVMYGSSPVNMAVGENRRTRNRVMRCWRCFPSGHIKKDCPSLETSFVRNLENEGGAR
jgi:hypothetical protein